MISENLTCKSIIYLYSPFMLRNDLTQSLFQLPWQQCMLAFKQALKLIKGFRRSKFYFVVFKSPYSSFLSPLFSCTQSFCLCLFLSVYLSFYTFLIEYFYEPNIAINTTDLNAEPLQVVLHGFWKSGPLKAKHSFGPTSSNILFFCKEIRQSSMKNTYRLSIISIYFHFYITFHLLGRLGRREKS